MSLFLLTFLSVYGAIHLYVLLKARSALTPGPGLMVMLVCFMTIMILAPIGVRLLERQGLHLVSRLLAYAGYTWMGLLFFFFWLGLCLDGFNLCMRLLDFLPGSSTGRLVWTGKTPFVFLTATTVLLGVWSIIDGWHIRLDRISLQTDKLPPRVNSLSIAQISDIHLGQMVGERRLARIVDLIEKAKPDLIVCSGDLVDAQMDRLDNLSNMLAALRPPYGKFAVTGNHEFYAGIRQSERFLRAAGFTVLRNRDYRVDGYLTIVGVDDPVGRRGSFDNGGGAQKESDLLALLDSRKYTLLLKHRPVVERESVGRFDLQLSGHTHGGQIFPFTLITGLFYENQSGLHDLGRGSLLHVSRGAGIWGPPMRFLAPPHVILIELKRKK
jgi:predicted MPP superfamily phosphohydrolase